MNKNIYLLGVMIIMISFLTGCAKNNTQTDDKKRREIERAAHNEKVANAFAHHQAVENVTRIELQNETDLFADQILFMALMNAEIFDEGTYTEAYEKIITADTYTSAIELYRDGDITAAGKLLGTSVKSAVNGATVDLTDYNFLMTVHEIVMETAEAHAKSWKNNDVSAAYRFYSGNEDNFDRAWSELTNVREQSTVDAIARENSIRTTKEMTTLPSGADTIMLQRVRLAYHKQFSVMHKMENKIATEEEKLHTLIEALEDANAFDPDLGPKGLTREPLHEKRLELMYGVVRDMMQQTQRFKITENKTESTELEIPIVDLVTGVQKYFHEPDGTERYQKYLEQRFKIGLYPTDEELEGEWEGIIRIDSVKVFKELGGAPDDYDVAQIEAAKNNEMPFNITIEITDDDKGEITSTSTKDRSSVPFSYTFVPKLNDRITSPLLFTYTGEKDGEKNNGRLRTAFESDKITGSMILDTIRNEERQTVMEGEANIDLLKGFIKIRGLVTATQK